jgi:phage regulator Rha-like protein
MDGVTVADLIPTGGIESRIFFLRGHKVLLDSDLADLYGIETKALNQAVKRNPERFPSDFMFEVDEAEVQILRSQIVTSRSGWGGRRSHPYAFTEHGVAMLASVLKSERAIQVNIAIVRAFVRMRKFLATRQGLARKLAKLGQQYDSNFRLVFDASEHLMGLAEVKKGRTIGFVKVPD